MSVLKNLCISAELSLKLKEVGFLRPSVCNFDVSGLPIEGYVSEHLQAYTSHELGLLLPTMYFKGDNSVHIDYSKDEFAESEDKRFYAKFDEKDAKRKVVNQMYILGRNDAEVKGKVLLFLINNKIFEGKMI